MNWHVTSLVKAMLHIQTTQVTPATYLELRVCLMHLVTPLIPGQCSLEFRAPHTPLSMFSGQKVNVLAELKDIKSKKYLHASKRQTGISGRSRKCPSATSVSFFSKESTSYFNIPQLHSHGNASFRKAVNINFISDYAHKR